jgi:Xaa-Pro aminopeptidase
MVRDAHLAVDLSSLTEAAFHEPDLKRLCQTLSAGGLAHISINDKIDQLRWQKSPNEQDLMKQTARIASESFNAMFR